MYIYDTTAQVNFPPLINHRARAFNNLTLYDYCNIVHICLNVKLRSVDYIDSGL